MANYDNQSPAEGRVRYKSGRGSASNGIYGLALIGAMVYYFQHAVTAGAYLLGFVKAIFWPAVLAYKIMEYLKM